MSQHGSDKGTEMTDTAENTDRELWREPSDGIGLEAYAPSVFVNECGGVGINVGGMVYVMPLRKWHALAVAASPRPHTLTNEDRG
jgi:hypothetical protein